MQMMGLLDAIFSTLEAKNLDRQQLIQQLAYLNEILPQIATEEERTKYFGIKISLHKRLIDISYHRVIAITKG